jgi:hypothetical protein
MMFPNTSGQKSSPIFTPSSQRPFAQSMQGGLSATVIAARLTNHITSPFFATMQGIVAEGFGAGKLA